MRTNDRLTLASAFLMTLGAGCTHQGENRGSPYSPPEEQTGGSTTREGTTGGTTSGGATATGQNGMGQMGGPSGTSEGTTSTARAAMKPRAEDVRREASRLKADVSDADVFTAFEGGSDQPLQGVSYLRERTGGTQFFVAVETARPGRYTITLQHGTCAALTGASGGMGSSGSMGGLGSGTSGMGSSSATPRVLGHLEVASDGRGRFDTILSPRDLNGMPATALTNEAIVLTSEATTGASGTQSGPSTMGQSQIAGCGDLIQAPAEIAPSSSRP